MSEFHLDFDQSGGDQIDQFALLARQDYNLGNSNDWFWHFRRGLIGHYARLSGVAIHYANMHEWLPVPQGRLMDYNLASFFFNADSALECFAYALNALGNAVDPSAFCDLSDDAALRKISPRNIIGQGHVKPLAGYSRYFPKLHNDWAQNRDLIERVMELHDVSKHRTTIYIGGMSQTEAPAGFYESLGITDSSTKAAFWPAKETLLLHEPKSSKLIRLPPENYERLEELAPRFCAFVNGMTMTAAQDAAATITLNEACFRE